MAVDYRGIGFETGYDVAYIVIRNVSSAPCRLTGPISAAPLDEQSRPLKTFRPLSILAVPPDVVLTADGALWNGEGAVPYGEAAVTIGGELRDNPVTGQSCRPADEVTPAFWEVTISAGSRTIANHDNGPNSQKRVPALAGCLASFNLGSIDTQTHS